MRHGGTRHLSANQAPTRGPVQPYVTEALAAWEISVPVCVTATLVRSICDRHADAGLSYAQVEACLRHLNRKAKAQAQR